MVKLWKILAPLFAVIAFATPANSLEGRLSPSIKKAYIASSVDGRRATAENKDVLSTDKVRLYFVTQPEIPKLDSSCKIEWNEIKAESEAYTNYQDRKFKIDRPNYSRRSIKETQGLEFEIEPPQEGTFRYSASLICNDKEVISTPGKESLTPIGISDKVHRISFRGDDSFLGWLSAFKNIPYIFGSTDEQIDSYIGVDCADLIIGARKKAGLNIPKTNISTSDIPRFARTIVSYKDLRIDQKGNFYKNGNPIVYGNDIKSSDIILFYEPTGKPWHVGVLIDGKEGEQLSIKSPMIHTLASPQTKKQIGDYGQFSILRWE